MFDLFLIHLGGIFLKSDRRKVCYAKGTDLRKKLHRWQNVIVGKKIAKKEMPMTIDDDKRASMKINERERSSQTPLFVISPFRSLQKNKGPVIRPEKPGDWAGYKCNRKDRDMLISQKNNRYLMKLWGSRYGTEFRTDDVVCRPVTKHLEPVNCAANGFANCTAAQTLWKWVRRRDFVTGGRSSFSGECPKIYVGTHCIITPYYRKPIHPIDWHI